MNLKFNSYILKILLINNSPIADNSIINGIICVCYYWMRLLLKEL